MAGVVAAVRTKRPYSPGNPAVSPAAVRAILRSTANDLGTAGFDFDHGFGNRRCMCSLQSISSSTALDICERYPWLCRNRPLEICRRYPWLCRRLGADADISQLEEMDLGELLEAVWQAGYFDGQRMTDIEGSNRVPYAAEGCGCDGAE